MILLSATGRESLILWLTVCPVCMRIEVLCLTGEGGGNVTKMSFVPPKHIL